MPGTTTPPTGSVLELLPLPKTADLSDAQRRGVNCVWCGIVLTPDTARDLGQRPTAEGVIFPRGCPSCVRSEAVRVHNVHSRNCTRCAADRTACTVRRALRRLALEGR